MNVHAERMTALLDGDFVVFLIGLRLNKPWKIHKWLPAALAMPKMMRELEANPELGLLGQIPGFKVSVQYWRSFEHLEAYATSKENEHLPAWKSFNQSVGRSRGDVGIWHETYLVRSGAYECVYSGMPKFGLGRVGDHVPVSGSRESAAGRLDSEFDAT